MDKYVKSLIEETFKSKKQQRFFFAKANDKDLPKKDRKKWGKWAKEFSDDTDYKKIPDEVENDVDEIVDVNGNIGRKKISKGSNFIFASRYEKNGGSDDDTLLTYIGNIIFTNLVKILFRIKISDILFTYILGETRKFKKLDLTI